MTNRLLPFVVVASVYSVCYLSHNTDVQKPKQVLSYVTKDMKKIFFAFCS